MSSPIRFVAVGGATGQQGGSIVSALSAEGYTVRALVRDPASAKAADLAKLPNVTVVKADYLDKASLIAAYEGVDAVFGCTAMTETEEVEGKNQADAALAANVSLFVWSTLPSVEAATNGAIKGVHHFDRKEHVDDHIRKIGLPAIFFRLGIFLENILNYRLLSYQDDEISLQAATSPDTRAPQVYLKKDLPPAFLLLIRNYPSLIGRTIYLAPIPDSVNEECEQLARITGKKAKYTPTNWDHYPEELHLMARFFDEYGLYKGETLPDPTLKDLGFVPSTFEDFAKEQLLPLIGL